MVQLVCRVGKGAMAHERTLFVRGVDREYESWADTRVVTILEGDLDQDQARGLVPVRLVQEDSEKGRVLVELPDETVMGTRRVWVPSSELKR